MLAFFLSQRLLVERFDKYYQGFFFLRSYNVVVAGFKLTHLAC